MPSLMIQEIDGQWVAEVSNTGIRYNFLGDTLEAQTQRVQYLAANMGENGDDLALFNKYIGNALDIGETVPETVTEQLYATTDMINYSGRMIYSAVGEEEFLIDVLDEAGEALMVVLGML